MATETFAEGVAVGRTDGVRGAHQDTDRVLPGVDNLVPQDGPAPVFGHGLHTLAGQMAALEERHPGVVHPADQAGEVRTAGTPVGCDRRGPLAPESDGVSSRRRERSPRVGPRRTQRQVLSGAGHRHPVGQGRDTVLGGHLDPETILPHHRQVHLETVGELIGVGELVAVAVHEHHRRPAVAGGRADSDPGHRVAHRRRIRGHTGGEPGTQPHTRQAQTAERGIGRRRRPSRLGSRPRARAGTVDRPHLHVVLGAYPESGDGVLQRSRPPRGAPDGPVGVHRPVGACLDISHVIRGDVRAAVFGRRGPLDGEFLPARRHRVDRRGVRHRQGHPHPA